METNRKIYNPLQKDYVTFLQTSEDTKGSYTLVEVELAPKGGVGIHYHKTYSELFHCLEGNLKVQLAKQIHLLKDGMRAEASPAIPHRFFNDSDKSCKFQVKITPACRGFEESLQIAYGLARDGKTRNNGFPKDKLALAWLFMISESNLPGWRSIFEWILIKQAKAAIKKGIDKQLREKYVKF
jgi:quercetin dioxygenase-like cupin family protein